MLLYVSCLEPEDFKTASILMDLDGCMDALALHAKLQCVTLLSSALAYRQDSRFPSGDTFLGMAQNHILQKRYKSPDQKNVVSHLNDLNVTLDTQISERSQQVASCPRWQRRGFSSPETVRSIPSSGQVEAAKDAQQDSNDVFVKIKLLTFFCYLM